MMSKLLSSLTISSIRDNGDPTESFEKPSCQYHAPLNTTTSFGLVFSHVSIHPGEALVCGNREIPKMSTEVVFIMITSHGEQ